MKKDKLIISITIFVMSLILSCVIFAQFKVVNETDIAQIESMREEELEEKITEWKEKYKKTEEKLNETKAKIQEYREKVESNDATKELVEKELEDSKRILGITDVNGEGIIITLEDNDEKKYDATDLLDLVNELRLAEAVAISINDERIINITDIVDIGNRYIRVNKNNVTSPFVVKAIGDRTYLKSALTIKNGYYDLKQKEGYGIEIQEKSNIKINQYSEEIELKYIKY